MHIFVAQTAPVVYLNGTLLFVGAWPSFKPTTVENLRKQYRDFRIDCIQVMLSVTVGSYPMDVPERLLKQERFRAYFKEQTAHGQDRWDAFPEQARRSFLT